MTRGQKKLIKSLSRARRWYESGDPLKRKLAMLIKFRNRIVYACDIGVTAKIAESCTFYHCGLGVVIGNSAVIGENCDIYQNVTIGARGFADGELPNPKIGDNVMIGAGAILLGDITIGDGAVIGAGAVVLESVPEKAIVAGNPGRVLRIGG